MHCASAFTEMRRAGITSVGEFHYLHHPDDDRWSGDRIVLEAAREAGIRIVLLQAHMSREDSVKPCRRPTPIRHE